MLCFSQNVLILLATFACIALGFLKSQKCFTKAGNAVAPFGRQEQLRHGEVE